MTANRTKHRNAFHCKLIVFALIFSITACAPSLPSTIKVPHISPVVKGPQVQKRRGYESTVYIDQLTDVRPKEAIAEYQGRGINPASDVIAPVIDALRAGLEKKGFRFSDTAPVLISGEIRTWSVKIKGGFSSKAKAEAVLYLEILDPTNKRAYSGVYQGYATTEGTGIDEERVSEILGTSMSEALGQVFADQQFIRLLSAF
jgi:uncharacterized lipoprotein YajG